MTVSTLTKSVVYRGNGAATQFAVPFKVLDEDHLTVKRQVYATGVLDYTYVGTDWSYSGIGDDSGTLTLAGTALDDDYQLVIERIVPYTQDLDIVNSGGFYPETVEEQLDLIVMGVQQVADLAERGLVVPVGEEGLVLPAAPLRINRYFGFGASGELTLLEGSVTAGDVISIPTLTNYGDVDATAEAAATYTAALADCGFGGTLFINVEVSIGAASIANPGVALIGERALYYTPGSGGGNRVINLPGRDTSLLAWGQECLARWHYDVLNRVATTAALCGDSNTEVHVGAYLFTFLDSLHNVTATNYGVSGTSMENWRAGTGGFSGGGASKNMAAVIAAAPKLMTICFGTNHPGDIDAEETSWRSALTTIRATLDVQECSILLMTPNAMNATDKDELWSMQLRAMIRQCAIDFQCAFFDQNGHFPDAFVDFGTGPNENNWLDSFRVHTTTLSRYMLASRIYEFLTNVPGVTVDKSGMRPDAVASVLNATALPSTYPKGFSMGRATTNFPHQGFVATFNPSSTGGEFGFQINWSITSTAASIRCVTATDTWSPWLTMGMPYLATDELAVADGLTSYPLGQSSMRVTTGFPLDGYVFTTREAASGNGGYQEIMSAVADVAMQYRTWVSGAWNAWRTK